MAKEIKEIKLPRKKPSNLREAMKLIRTVISDDLIRTMTENEFMTYCLYGRLRSKMTIHWVIDGKKDFVHWLTVMGVDQYKISTLVLLMTYRAVHRKRFNLRETIQKLSKDQ